MSTVAAGIVAIAKECGESDWPWRGGSPIRRSGSVTIGGPLLGARIRPAAMCGEDDDGRNRLKRVYDLRFAHRLPGTRGKQAVVHRKRCPTPCRRIPQRAAAERDAASSSRAPRARPGPHVWTGVWTTSPTVFVPHRKCNVHVAIGHHAHQLPVLDRRQEAAVAVQHQCRRSSETSKRWTLKIDTLGIGGVGPHSGGRRPWMREPCTEFQTMQVLVFQIRWPAIRAPGVRRPRDPASRDDRSAAPNSSSACASR